MMNKMYRNPGMVHASICRQMAAFILRPTKACQFRLGYGG